jgi:isopentenyl phosphate kinase
VVYGDVALDERQGGTIISTEEIFRWLAPRLAPDRVLLVGEVEGVLSADPASGQPGELIPAITPEDVTRWAPVLGASRGVDVTGGMLAKIQQMLAMVAAVPSLQSVQLISGLAPGLTRSALVDPHVAAGTRIRGAR